LGDDELRMAYCEALVARVESRRAAKKAS